MSVGITMKLKWRFLALFRGKHKKQVHLWIFLGIMTISTFIYSHVAHQQVQEYVTERVHGDNDMQKLGVKFQDPDGLVIGFDPKNTRDSSEFDSTEEIDLSDHIKKIESEVRHMGIYRKTLSKTLKKSKKPSSGTNSSQAEMVKDKTHVVEVTNLKDEQTEELSLEADGYMSVGVIGIEVDPDKHKVTESKQSVGNSDVVMTARNHKGYGKPVTNQNQGTVIDRGDMVKSSTVNQNKLRKADTNVINHKENTMDSQRTKKYPGEKRNRQNYTVDVEDFGTEFQAIKKCNEVRLKRIRERCNDLDFKSLEAHSLEETKSLVSKVITDNKHRVLINAVPKTGTSSWKMVMLNNSGLVISENGRLPPGNAINDWQLLKSYGLEDLRNYNPDEIQLRLASYYSILTVRHPFERLESAFRQKFQNSQSTVYTETVAKKIVEKFRQGNMSLANRTQFSHGPIRVTFEEFLRYALSSESNDRHWNTYWDIANPCVLRYKYIAKTETADLDMDFIAATKLSTGQSRGSFKYNPTQKGLPMCTRVQGNTLELFSQLRPETQNSLLFATLDKYMNDMELFGYRIHKEGHKVISECHYYSEEGLCC